MQQSLGVQVATASDKGFAPSDLTGFAAVFGGGAALAWLCAHHPAAFLIAIAWPAEALKRGMPARFRALVESRALIPAVHFGAMIDPRLYAIMNWSMVVDGILFWCLVLDPRPQPPARTSYAARMVLCFAVIASVMLRPSTPVQLPRN